ncbi:acetaldehyde dehydrogenase (acetylating) [Parendozoicomonas haliclonae]|uniref:Aldehyde-alcohol dehydrogenase n=1 Tax=Parendozoicomonas haliclonae TaxID=1960125 RepID=A0A1X7ANX4_9GAMM|nr:acetaldehyde dehydrogenase (acetylating) [Parendozoicomonas haliclonae]SMA48779.1 Aldehyde-alcohol dehydrogenase [Parendozoicomonas haliclonae]
MELLDKDLLSVQNVRTLLRKAKAAQLVLAEYDQARVDTLVKAMADVAELHARELAEMAHEETGFGKVEDKVTKNLLASRILWDSIKDMKTVGIIAEKPEQKMFEVGVPFGIVAGLVPSTNPTSTAIYKAMISIKSGNAIVISPHPSALKAIIRTVELLRGALARHGAPEDLISVMTVPTLEGTSELMKNQDTGIILATGGSAMVRAAYSSGTPALGVGPGNVPAFIERTADIKKAVHHVITSTTFDNGTICASEQHVVVEHAIADQVKAEMIAQGCYFLNEAEIAKVEKVIVNERGGLNARIVGKAATVIAEMAGVQVPASTRVLVGEQGRNNVGKKFPFSWEKLSPLLGFYRVNDAHDACELCLDLLTYEGAGHTLAIHTQNDALVREFALKKPVSRLVVNTPSTHGGVGATTGIAPAFTLGCGSVGGSATSDNVTPLNLITKRYVAYGLIEPEELSPAPAAATVEAAGVDIEAITRMVLAQLQGR